MTAEQYFTEHGISDLSIQKFNLTWDRNKITIPICDIQGEFLYNKYRYLNNPEMKYGFDKGSSTSLFNIQALENAEYVFITEGEMDAIRLIQDGIVAVTNTSGATTFKEEWLPYFEGKRVYIVYDSDEAGKAGALKVKEKLPKAKIISLPEECKDICEFFALYPKEAFTELVERQTKEDKLTFEGLSEVIDRWLLLPDKNVIRILLATLVAHQFDTDPLWMFFVAPPSGSKTEIISTISSLDFCYMLSDLTPNTLASGMPCKKDFDPSLLSQLKNNVLIMKDFTTVLNMRFEDKAMILSQLREVYDGKYSKQFGTGKKVDWEGRLTLIAGVTSIIDTHSSVFQTMGERFVMYRIAQADDEAVADKALTNNGSEKKMREELKKAMVGFFNNLDIPAVDDITLPVEIRKSLGALASFVVIARTGLVRDNFKKELIYIPQTEAPARLAKQLGTLIKALPVLEGRREVTWKDYYLVLKVALDVIPANRSRHLMAICTPDMRSTTEIAQITDYSRNGSELILEDLTALGVARVIRGGSGSPNQWGLSDKTKERFRKIIPVNIEKELKAIFPDDSEYKLLINEILQGSFTTTQLAWADEADNL